MNTKSLSWILPLAVVLVVVAALLWVLMSGPRQSPQVASGSETPPRPPRIDRVEATRPTSVRSMNDSAPGDVDASPTAALPTVTPIPTLPPEAAKRPVRISGEIVIVERENLPPERRAEFPPVPRNAERPREFLLASVTLIDPATRLSARSDASGRFTLETEALDTADSVNVLIDGYFLTPLDGRTLLTVPVPPGGDASVRIEMVNRPGLHLRMPDGREVTDAMLSDPEVMQWVSDRFTAFQMEIGAPPGTPDRLGVGPEGGFGRARRSIQVREGDAPIDIQIRGFVMPEESGS